MSVASLKGRDFLSMADFSPEEVRALLTLAANLKSGRLKPQCRKTLGLLFSKASTRTRVSFSSAIFQLGGHVLDLNVSVTQVNRGEPTKDTARILASYLDVLAIRTFEQTEIESDFQLKVFPNPTIQYLYLTSTGNETARLKYQIFQADGKLLYAGSTSLHPGEKLELAEVEQLAPGNYFLDARDATGAQQVLQFVKKSY